MVGNVSTAAETRGRHRSGASTSDNVVMLVLGVVLVASLSAFAIAILFMLLNSDLDRFGKTGEFLGYVAGFVLTATSIAITVRIARAANLLSRRVGDSDILDFVDSRLNASIDGVRSVAGVLDTMREGAASVASLLGEIARKFLEEAQKEENSKKVSEIYGEDQTDEIEIYEKLSTLACHIILNVARPELLAIRSALRDIHEALKTSLKEIEKAPLTMALTRAALSREPEEIAKNGDDGLGATNSFRRRAVTLALEKLRHDDPGTDFSAYNLPDILLRLQQCLEQGGLLDASEENLGPLARNVWEVLILEAIGGNPHHALLLLGAVIDYKPIFRNGGADWDTTKDGDDIGIVFNRGLVLLATIYELMPDTDDFGDFFAKVYPDGPSLDLTKRFLSICGFSRDMFWTTEAKQDWKSVHGRSFDAVNIIVRDRNSPFLGIRLDAIPSHFETLVEKKPQAFWPWQSRDRLRVLTATADRSVVARIDTLVEKGTSLQKACESYAVTTDDLERAREKFGTALWLGPIGNRAMENWWAKMLGQGFLQRGSISGTEQKRKRAA